MRSCDCSLRSSDYDDNCLVINNGLECRAENNEETVVWTKRSSRSPILVAADTSDIVGYTHDFYNNQMITLDRFFKRVLARYQSSESVSCKDMNTCLTLGLRSGSSRNYLVSAQYCFLAWRDDELDREDKKLTALLCMGEALRKMDLISETRFVFERISDQYRISSHSRNKLKYKRPERFTYVVS